MKNFLCILLLALSYRVSSYPVKEESQSVSTSSNVPPVLANSNVSDLKSEVSSTPAAVREKGVQENSSPQKELSSTASSSTPSSDLKSSPKEEPVPDSSKQSLTGSGGQVNKVSGNVVNSVLESVKSEPETRTELQAAETAQKTDNKIEPVAVSSEQPKESNSQINAVSVEEPKPVQNEVKSEIPKEETKSEGVKNEVKSEKLEELKSVKIDQAPVANSQVKQEERPVSSEESGKKADTSSEEKQESAERNDSKESEKKESAPKEEQKKESEVLKPEVTSAKSEPSAGEVKKENRDEKKDAKDEKKDAKDEKKEIKEENSAKPVAQSQSSDQAKSTSAVSPPAAEKLEGEREVIKREAGSKDKFEEKKSTESFAKKDKVKSSSMQKELDEMKNTKSQE